MLELPDTTRRVSELNKNHVSQSRKTKLCLLDHR